jgi:hypothetical protein
MTQAFVCAICGRGARLSCVKAQRLGWDWFTQGNPRRTDICPECMENRRVVRDDLFFRAQNAAAIRAMKDEKP